MKTMRGFTIIEAILAMALMAAGVFGLLYTFQGSMANSILVEQSYLATNLARATMEEIIARRDSRQTGGGYANTLSAIQSNSYNQTPVSGFPSINITTTAVEVDPGTTNDPTNFTIAQPNSGFARVTVTATYNGANDSVTLVTIMAAY